MPELQVFRDAESYYATAAHELCHWTQHPSRLDRDLGGTGYAMEELVAEIGTAFLCGVRLHKGTRTPIGILVLS